jgi:chemotaxis protein methyltransferase CheR
VIAPDDYEFLSALLKRRSGLTLGDGKAYLLESRLPAVAATFNLTDIPAVVRALRVGANEALAKAVCDAMTTAETMFFRDDAPFRELKDALLPAAATRCREAGRPLRIWSAACSTGQEPYSIAMTVHGLRAALGQLPVEIAASDYSSAQLARAREGVYNSFEVQRGLPVTLMIAHFQPAGDGYRVSEELRRMVSFHERNLLESFAALPKFDVIFCRNVLIYFDVQAKADVLGRMAQQLTPGGVVILGGSETTLGITDALERREGSTAGVYVRRVVKGAVPNAA